MVCDDFIQMVERVLLLKHAHLPAILAVRNVQYWLYISYNNNKDITEKENEKLDIDPGWDGVYPTVWAYVCVDTQCHSRAWPQPLYYHEWCPIAPGARPLKTRYLVH